MGLLALHSFLTASAPANNRPLALAHFPDRLLPHRPIVAHNYLCNSDTIESSVEKRVSGGIHDTNGLMDMQLFQSYGPRIGPHTFLPCPMYSSASSHCSITALTSCISPCPTFSQYSSLQKHSLFMFTWFLSIHLQPLCGRPPGTERCHLSSGML